jgi:CBS domain-containing protein
MRVHEPSHRIRPLDQLRAIDAMHPGMISCPPETPLRTIARMMATYRVHAIIVHALDDDELPGGGQWGVVTDGDLVRAALDDSLDELPAGQIAVTPALVVPTTEPLNDAIRVMVEHEVSHLIVVERHTGRPIGVISTLDVARALAGLA